ncbi:MAG: transcriptional regulator, partial [Candidatus Glassbacteria bacterium RBG_16_58_8]
MNIYSGSMLLVDKRTAKSVKAAIEPESQIHRLSDFFKIMGDSTRLKIILALSQGELCVCDLAAIIGVSSSAASHQLRILRGARLVQYRREG